MRKRTIVRFLTVVLGLASPPAAGQERRAARLTVRVAPGLSACGGEVELRSAVIARLGYDPFDPGGPLAVEVVLTPRGARAHGRFSLGTPQDPRAGRREMSAPAAECRELVLALGLSIALALDPAGVEAREAARDLPRREAEGAVQRRPARMEPEPPPATRQPEPEPEPVGDPLRGLVSVAAGLALGRSPAVASPVVAVAAGLRQRHWSLELGLAGALPVPVQVFLGPVAEPGTLEVGDLVIELVACYRVGWFDACGMVEGGGLWANDTPAPLLGVGTGVRLDVPLGTAVALAIAAELRVPLVTVRVHGPDGSPVVWELPPVQGQLRAGMLFVFP
jgi:hypothetical protein